MFGAVLLNRRIRRTPRFSCAALPENTAGKLVGLVVPFERELVAPVSLRRCVYYRIEVVQDLDPGEGTARPLLVEQQRAVEFLVRDATGDALIAPQGAAIAIATDHRISTTDFETLTAAQLTLLAEHGARVRGRNLRVSFRESALVVGSAVAVAGAGTRETYLEGQATGTYREGPATRLRMMHSVGLPLRITDDPKTAAAGEL